MSGTPLQAKKRIQLNVQLMQIDKLELFKGLSSEQLIPFIWVEEVKYRLKKITLIFIHMYVCKISYY